MAFKCLLEHIYIYTYIHNSEYQWDIFSPKIGNMNKKVVTNVISSYAGSERSSGIIGFWDCWITIIIDSIAPDIVVNDGKWM